MTTDDLLRFTPSGSPDQARLSIDTARRSAEPINPYLFGKFCEHLGQNIYQGMDAQILANPTFARWIFSAGDDQVNGGMAAEYDPVRIAQGAADRAARLGLPDGDLLAREYLDGLAFGWFRLGTRAEARVSADVGPHGDRAQRLEVLDAAGGQPQGLAQWIYLPLHRTRGYVYRLVARASAPVELEISLAPGDAAGRCGAALAAGSRVRGR
jgi:alpha-N-arabinofuranosidase